MNQNQVPLREESVSDQSDGLTCNHQADDLNKTLESIKLTSEQLSTDRRVPLEVWQKICSYLYPSQLSRMSMVNTTLHAVVDSLPYWSLLFRRIFGSKKDLWLLPLVSKSRSYMLYMCACSSMVCEQCHKYFDNYLEVDNAATLPLPVQVESLHRKHKDVLLIGCPVEPNWTIQMCLPCRKNHYSEFEESIPYAVHRNILSPQDIRKKFYINAIECTTARDIHRNYLEREVIKLARLRYGGDVGIRAMAIGSIDERFERNDSKILGYSYR